MEKQEILNALIIACGLTKRGASVLLNITETTLGKKLKGDKYYVIYDDEIRILLNIYDSQSLPYANFKNSSQLPSLRDVAIVEKMPLAQVIIEKYLQEK